MRQVISPIESIVKSMNPNGSKVRSPNPKN